MVLAAVLVAADVREPAQGLAWQAAKRAALAAWQPECQPVLEAARRPARDHV